MLSSWCLTHRRTLSGMLLSEAVIARSVPTRRGLDREDEQSCGTRDGAGTADKTDPTPPTEPVGATQPDAIQRTAKGSSQEDEPEGTNEQRPRPRGVFGEVWGSSEYNVNTRYPYVSSVARYSFGRPVVSRILCVGLMLRRCAVVRWLQAREVGGPFWNMNEVGDLHSPPVSLWYRGRLDG